MTRPLPHDNTESFDVLRKRWLSRYMKIQTEHDAEIRKILAEAADNAEQQIAYLDTKTTFSSGVRAAQLKLVMKEVKDVLGGVFNDVTPRIRLRQKQEAVAAIDGLTETDREYLQKVFSNTGEVNSFIASQKQQAQIQVVNAINRITKSDRPLSSRVYRTQALSQRWVQRDVTIEIAKGSSAKEIAKVVRKHIRPNAPGGVSYAALRLGRTELNNAFHATAITFSQERPWVKGMQWHLSAVHEHNPGKVEICETFADQIFDVDHVPAKPHPQCRCFVAPVIEPIDVFTRNLTAGYYKDWIGNAA